MAMFYLVVFDLDDVGFPCANCFGLKSLTVVLGHRIDWLGLSAVKGAPKFICIPFSDTHTHTHQTSLCERV